MKTPRILIAALLLAPAWAASLDEPTRKLSRDILQELIDLTTRARTGKLDPVIGRDEEIRRVIQVLSRRTKNNPVLIGEPGVGRYLSWKDSPSAS